jgi:hypothetical protein
MCTLCFRQPLHFFLFLHAFVVCATIASFVVAAVQEMKMDEDERGQVRKKTKAENGEPRVQLLLGRFRPVRRHGCKGLTDIRQIKCIFDNAQCIFFCF